jgi:ABC-type oligopeptide transport system substrate-binding subunit
VIAGRATELEGFRIPPTEFLIDLEKPIAFFPVLLAYPALAIVPEGTGKVGELAGRLRRHGPFRVVSFEPGRRLETERNPSYWREGFPKSEGLVFHFGVTSETIRNEFLAGRYSIASDLLPVDVEAFRQNPLYAPNYREVPRLTTYYVAFNSHKGFFADAERRRDVAAAFNASEIVRRTLGRIAVPATGLIPRTARLGCRSRGKGLAGGPPGRRVGRAHRLARLDRAFGRPASRLPREFSAFYAEFQQTLREAGFILRPVNGDSMPEFLEATGRADADMFIGRWNADYPDADTFVHGVLHSQAGLNRNFCSTPEIDRLAEQGRAELDPRARHSIYRKVEELLARDVLIAPLFHERLYRFARPEVEGLTVSFAGTAVPYEELRIRR